MMKPEELLEYNEFIADGAQYLPGSFNELAKLLHDAKNSSKKLKVKLGIDPTSTDLHFGHTVCLHFLRKFQEHGHIPNLIIGDFTATVGDPSGRNEARPPLTLEQARENAETYLNQVHKILDKNKTKIFYNSEWLSKLSSVKLLELAHLVTVNQLIGKEAFGVRIEKGEPLFLHEALYPLLQGYDSIAIDADIEIGGIDQTFNVLFGRHIQKCYGKKEQFVLLLPLLIGLDGKKKMSKSFNNHIALNDPPNEIYGKAMSIPDELIFHYLKLVSTFKADELFSYEKELNNQNTNPRDIKMILAYNLVEQLHGSKVAGESRDAFIKQFRMNELPENINEFSLKEPLKVIDLMYASKLVPSKAEAKRLIEGGGVKLSSAKIADPNLLITVKDKNSVLQIGKRKFLKIV